MFMNSWLRTPRPGWRTRFGLVTALALSCASALAATTNEAKLAPLRARTAAANQARPPGVVIHHSPQSSGLYIGSPSLTVLPDGRYLASHDFFGPKSEEHVAPTSVVFRSSDRGATWQEVARIKPLFWANLFVHRGAAYIMGTDKHHGRIVIRRSNDGGATWTEPRDGATGLLASEGQYHTAPVPMVEHRGRLWRGFEDAMGGTDWGKRYRAHMLSVAVGADLLQAANWLISNPATRDPQWLNGTFNAWLEGNAVVTREGGIVNVLRVDTPGLPEKAAIIQVDGNGRSLRFDPATGFVDFPGGAKKFTIRFDPTSDRYWSLATVVLADRPATGKPAGIRNTLALTSSTDLRTWEARCLLLHHPDVARHGFQYPDWQFEGEDIIAAVRTAYDDAETGAHNNHDANYLTFHRFKGFRRLSQADSVPVSPVGLGQNVQTNSAAAKQSDASSPAQQGRQRPEAVRKSSERRTMDE